MDFNEGNFINLSRCIDHFFLKHKEIFQYYIIF